MIAAAALALWLGILTSISPCPLASNIAAVSFIGRRVGHARHVLLSGLLYTAGRTATYVGLGVLLVGLVRWLPGLAPSGGQVSRFLGTYANLALGPVLILAGMLLLGLIGLPGSLSLGGMGVQRRAAEGGIAWAAILGILFALSFCPVSAGLFFGGLLGLSLANDSAVLLPSLYGVGTAVPVLAFAFLMAGASQLVGRAFQRLTQIERYVRGATGVVFILAGVYYCLTYIYGLNLMAW